MAANNTTSPDLKAWMLTYLFYDAALSLEFYDRMVNLCNYEYPMTPNLRALVSERFGFDLVHVIEQYKGLESPVLSSSNKAIIRSVIPDEFYLEFIRLFDCSCCPIVIGEYGSIDAAPDGTSVGQLVVVRYITDDTRNHIHLYEWNGTIWEIKIDTSSAIDLGFFLKFQIEDLDTLWEVSIDEGVTWLNTVFNYNIDPPQTSITIWFRNTDNGCIYTNLPQIPLCPTNAGIWPDPLTFPVGNVIGDVVMLASNDGLFIYRNIYEWDGADWISQLELLTVNNAPFSAVSVIANLHTYEFSVDSGSVWWQIDPPFQANFPEQSSIPCWFRKIGTECIYVSDVISQV